MPTAGTRTDTLTWPLLACALAAGGATAAEQATPADDPWTALTTGTPSLNARYRYEHVDQESRPHPAHASTLRTRLGYATRPWQGITAFLELEDIRPVGQELFDDTRNGRTAYGVVADPRATEVNQAWGQYGLDRVGTLRVGRQRLAFDNQRHVGDSAWRQNQQTFDAALATVTAIDHLVASYAYVVDVNRVDARDVRMRTHLANARVTLDGIATIAGYAYLFGLRGATAPTSHATYGARATTTQKLGEIGLLGALEGAVQQPHRDGSDRNEAGYGIAEVGATLAGAKLVLGGEVLGGDGVYAFQTPFASFHPFNGWVDRFTITPADGLRDLYAIASYARGPVTATVGAHRFWDDGGTRRYGDEVDAAVEWTVRPGVKVGGKYAAYFGDAGAPPALALDVHKAWGWVELVF